MMLVERGSASLSSHDAGWLMTIDAEEELIQQIYAAAYDPAQWIGVMEKLSDAVGGLRGCLTRLNVDTGEGVEAILSRSDPAWAEAYAQHFFGVNVFLSPHDATAASAPVATDEDCLPHDDYRATEYFNDFMRPQQLDRVLFLRLGVAGDVVTDINIGRREGQVFEMSDIELAARLQPHMTRAFEIGRRLGGAVRLAGNFAEALQHSPHPLFLVDADCVLLFANRMAERLLAQNSGLLVINNRLVPAHSDSARQFEKLIGRAAHRGPGRAGGSMKAMRADGRFPLAIRTSPLPLDEGPVMRASAPVLVSVTDLDADVTAPSTQLTDLFDLTAAEVRLAAAVFEGLSLPEAAERFGVSINTVRFQLARIFDKTGVSRQADLVKLMMRLAGA